MNNRPSTYNVSAARKSLTLLRKRFDTAYRTRDYQVDGALELAVRVLSALVGGIGPLRCDRKWT